MIDFFSGAFNVVKKAFAGEAMKAGFKSAFSKEGQAITGPVGYTAPQAFRLTGLDMPMITPGTAGRVKTPEAISPEYVLAMWNKRLYGGANSYTGTSLPSLNRKRKI